MDIFDILCNANEMIEDQILLNEIAVQITKNVLDAVQKNQEYLVDQYEKLKTDLAKEVLQESVNNGYIELLKLEEQYKEAKKALQKAKKQQKEIT